MGYTVSAVLDLNNNKLTKAHELHAIKKDLEALGLAGNETGLILSQIWHKSIYNSYLQENKIKRIERLQSGTHFKDLYTLKLNNNTLEAFGIQFLSHFAHRGVVYLEGSQLTT